VAVSEVVEAEFWEVVLTDEASPEGADGVGVE
jgi:hypothetical protein